MSLLRRSPNIMQLLDFALVVIYTLGLRQLIFEYKKTAYIRDFLLTTPLAELARCVYCQAIECAVLALILRQYIEPVLVVLSVGFVTIALDAWIFKAIANMEEIRSPKNENQSKSQGEGQDSTQQE